MISAPLLRSVEAIQEKKDYRTAGKLESKDIREVWQTWGGAFILPLLAVALLNVQMAWSQTPKSAGISSPAQQKVAQVAVLDGRITDANGTALAGADVTVENVTSHRKFQATSDSGGGFSITDLPAGEFSLQVSKPGFKRFIINKMPLVVGDQARATVKMQAGAANEVVVGAPTSVVSRAGTALAGKDLNDIPENQRNFVNLVQLTNGANEGNTNQADSNSRPGAQHASSSVSLGGQQEATNNTQIDGIDNNDRANGTIAVNGYFHMLPKI